MVSLLSLLSYAVAIPLALAVVVCLFGAYWPVALLVLGGCVGVYRLGHQAEQASAAE